MILEVMSIFRARYFSWRTMLVDYYVLVVLCWVQVKKESQICSMMEIFNDLSVGCGTQIFLAGLSTYI